MSKHLNAYCRAVCLVFCLLVLMFLTSGESLAQSNVYGAIGGTVTDQSGAVLPGAVITVLNPETNTTTTATSDSAGGFRVLNLRPSKYEVSVAAPGFAEYKQSGIIVEVGRVTPFDISLGITAKSYSVQVTAEAPVVNTEEPEFSTNINQTSINELPINGRRWSVFALATPGTALDGNFGLVSFRGVSGLLNNNTIDGGDNNQAFFSEEKGRTRLGYSISQAAVREFQVNTSNYSAEYGRAAGGVVNAITKSGTNNFHGSGFYYIRDNALGARNAFSFISKLVGGVPTQVPLKPEDRRHQFGGTLGGPLIRDRIFFFLSYDQQRRNFPGIAAPSNPRFFNPFSARESAVFATRGITPAQQAAGLAFLTSLTGQVSRRGDQWLILPKIDFKLNNDHTASLSYNRLRWNSPAGIQTQPVVSRGIASFGDDLVKGDSFIFRLTSTLSPHIANEARFQWSRDFEFERSQPPAPGEPTTGPGGRPPQIGIFGGGITFGKPNFLERRALPDEGRYQYSDSVSFAYGRHLLKAGTDINLVTDLIDNLFSEGGVYSYNNRVDFISDFSNPAGKRYSNFTQAFGPSAFRFATKDLDFFLQDDWRVHPRLTLNLGLRYEYELMPSAQIPNPILPETTRFPDDRNNIGPRVGLAWDVTGNGKTSVRGGYGIYYGRIINANIFEAIVSTASAGSQKQFSFRPNTAGSPVYPNVLTVPPALVANPPSVIVFGPNAQNPMVHEFDAIFEREIGHNTVASVSYIGSRGRDLPRFIDRNLPASSGPITYKVSGGPFDGRSFSIPLYSAPRPNPKFTTITNLETTVSSQYDAFVAQLNRRLTSGLQFQINYTYAHSTDTGQSSTTTFSPFSNVLDPNNLALEKGRSNSDIRHRFVANAIWQPDYFKDSGPVARALFSGYSIAPIVNVSSGHPFTATVQGNAPGGRSFGVNGAGPNSDANRTFFLPRNSFQFPVVADVALRVSRRFKIREVGNLEVLAEAFNLFNRVNLTDVNTDQYSIETGPTLNYIPDFGTGAAAGATVFRERQVQFAVRFEF